MIYRILAVMTLALASVSGVQAQQSAEQAPSARQAPTPPPATAPAPRAGQAQPSPLGAGQAISPQLSEMTVAEISGRPLISSGGAQLGTVQQIARDKQNGSLNAIVNVGGFLGFGARQVAVPLEQIQFQDDKLLTAMAESKDELKSRATAYNEDRYEMLTEQTRIADAAKGAAPGQPPAGQMAGANFENLDADADGYISAQEAQQHDVLSDRWGTLDMNRDGRLDRAEFAAFAETTGGAAGAQGQTRQPDQMPQQDSMRKQDQIQQQDQMRQ